MANSSDQIRIILINIHGLLKGSGLEIGRDADNGGQTKYVYEFAEHLSNHSWVKQVHIFTRLIEDPELSEEYSEPVEILNPKLDIRRLEFGGRKYLLKEQLWEHLDEFVHEAFQHIKKHQIFPDWIHSHYGDAGYTAVELSKMLNVPFTHTGHSLGIHKRQKLIGEGMSADEADNIYKFPQRIAAEESTLMLSQFIITSTEQEISSYEEYENFSLAHYQVIPPGIDTEKFFPYYQEKVQENTIEPEELQRRYWVGEYIEKFLINPHKPVIMALSRPDRRKNLHTLIDVYGQDRELQSLANLVIFAGIRKDINQMPESEKEVLTNILLSMDKYDLYGKLAIPKKHDVENEVDTIYRYCAEKRGAFVNLTLYENFGLTTIEAGASGLPVVVTRNGGPSEIIPVCENGILVDPLNPSEIKEALVKILTNEQLWKRFSNNGIINVQKNFSWESHVERYLHLVKENIQIMEQDRLDCEIPPRFNLSEEVNKMLVSDIDGTLILPEKKNPGLEQLFTELNNRKNGTVFAVASGRNLDLVQDAIETYNFPTPDIIIASVGAEIFYQCPELVEDKSWAKYLRKDWDRDEIAKRLKQVSWMRLQEEEAQKEFKISYYYREKDYHEEELKTILSDYWHQINVIASHGSFIDILPKKASKGHALIYLCHKWNIPMDQVFAAGDSGNDLDMFRGDIKGIIVGNHSQELSELEPSQNLYIADKFAAAGISEGLQHYGFKF